MANTGAQGRDEIGKGRFVQYRFYRIAPEWRGLPAVLREAHKRELIETVRGADSAVRVRSYSLTGLRADADFLLWSDAPSPDALQELGAAINATAIAPYLTVPHSYLAITKRSVYVSNHQHEGQDGRRLTVIPSGARYLFVYPFVKTRAWYACSLEERQRMMNEHIRIGHKYPSVKLNTTYSFGLDDQEFVVAFETDEPSDFVDLVMELRHTDSSMYTLRDTPIFTCIAMPLADALEMLGGVREPAVALS